MPTAHDPIIDCIRARGPITAAEFMELALYHPEHGYYSSAPRRSGRSGDFITSVDAGPLFGEMIAVQLAEMWELLGAAGAERLDLVEAGAGDGRLAGDILDALAREDPGLYQRLVVTLVERSPAAARAQRERLAKHGDRVRSAEHLPDDITGVILANELLDALPVHVVVMTDEGLREVYVTEREGSLAETVGPLSDPEIALYLAALGLTLERGWRAEVGLGRAAWVSDAAAALAQGFLLIFDYGHEAQELYSATHSNGTLMAYSRHTAGARSWLDSPGGCDLTAHVDFTSVRRAAEHAGLVTLGAVDQTYFLTDLGIVGRLSGDSGVEAMNRRLAAKTLLLPGGLGSTIKVLAFGKGVGQPSLAGLTAGRVT